MAMSEFEKKLIAELKGIKEELQKLNKGNIPKQFQLASPLLKEPATDKEVLSTTNEADALDFSHKAFINNRLENKE